MSFSSSFTALLLATLAGGASLTACDSGDAGSGGSGGAGGGAASSGSQGGGGDFGLQPGAAGTGLLAYASEEGDEFRMAVLSLDTATRVFTSEPGVDLEGAPYLSSDGSTLVYKVRLDSNDRRCVRIDLGSGTSEDCTPPDTLLFIDVFGVSGDGARVAVGALTSSGRQFGVWESGSFTSWYSAPANALSPLARGGAFAAAGDKLVLALTTDEVSEIVEVRETGPRQAYVFPSTLKLNGQDASMALSDDASRAVLLGYDADFDLGDSVAIALELADGAASVHEDVFRVSISQDGETLVTAAPGAGLATAPFGSPGSRTTIVEAETEAAVFSPDGSRIAYRVVSGADNYSLYSCKTDGTDVQRVTPRTSETPPVWPLSWSR